MDKYVFSDITVYMQVRDGYYINLTDFSLECEDTEYLSFNGKGKYVIMLCSYMYAVNKKRGKENYACDITLEELIRLAGLGDEKIVMRFKSPSGEMHEDVLALLCAKKVLDYNYGRVVVKDDNTYSFSRQKYIKGTKRKTQDVVVEKKYYEV